jgi:hypothetical protein
MPTNSIQRYYQEVEKLKQRGGTKMESTISQAFYTLLNDYAQQKELTLVPQVWVKGKLGREVKPDGTRVENINNWDLEQFRKRYCHPERSEGSDTRNNDRDSSVAHPVRASLPQNDK